MKASWAIPLTATLLWGCDVHFVDPRPPVFTDQKITLSAGTLPAPIVFGFMFDLNFSDDPSCEAFQNQLEDQVNNYLTTGPYPGLELPRVQLAPLCTQSSYRRLDIFQIEQDISNARAAFPNGIVRPLYFYVNNVELPLPAELVSDFEELKARASERGDPVPLIWDIATQSVYGSYTDFDGNVLFTRSDDPVMTHDFNAGLVQELPLLYPAIQNEQVPLLPDSALTQFQAFKICSMDPNVGAINFDPSQPSVALAPNNPPQISVTFPSASPVQARDYAEPQSTINVELCSANCDRLLTVSDGTTTSLEKWSAVSQCEGTQQ